MPDELLAKYREIGKLVGRPVRAHSPSGLKYTFIILHPYVGKALTHDAIRVRGEVWVKHTASTTWEHYPGLPIDQYRFQEL